MEIIAVWFQLIGRVLVAIMRWVRHEPVAAGLLVITAPGIGPARIFMPSPPVGGDVLDWAWAVLAACWAWAGVTGEPLHLAAWVRHDVQRARQVIGGTAAPVGTAVPEPGLRAAPVPAHAGSATIGFAPGTVGYTPRAVDYDALGLALRQRIIGQDHAIDALIAALKRRAVGLGGDQIRPLSGLFAGPTGVGKTELAKALAQATGRELIRYDMANLHDQYTSAAFVGAPPGYVGSDRPGRLVADIASRPRAVILFDELEKAYRTVLDPLLRLVDEGWATELSQGLRADARECTLLFTTNLLSSEAVHEWTDDQAKIRQLLVNTGALRPEFVNRVDIVALFKPFDDAQLANVIRKLIADYLTAWAAREKLQVQVQVHNAVVQVIASRCDPAFGARDAQRIIADVVGNTLTQAYLPLKQQGRKPAHVHVALGDGNEIALHIE